jgi:hypothetical protein
MNISLKICVLEKKIDTLDSKILQLSSKIDTILELLTNEVKPSCNKMNDHINFIETVYDTIKSPMEIICNKINYLRINSS